MFSKSLRSLLLISAAWTQLGGAAPAARDDSSNARTAFITLQKWYNDSSGLYDTTGWWNSANCLTAIGDLAALNPAVKSTAIPVLSNSFTAAQNTSLQMNKVLSGFIMETLLDLELPVVNPKGFLNGYYDDEGWWALAWIQAYDVTGDASYLTMAEDVFADMKNTGATTPCGGIWWDKAHTYVNAIANELYLSVASHLANRETSPSQKSNYLSLAQQQWKWFQDSGMINSGNTINDGLTTDCKNNGGTVWSYNQGVILGALAELNKADSDGEYLNKAKDIATAAISSLGSSGVLKDPCEPNCGADGNQFKGVFMRGLQRLQEASPEAQFAKFTQANADSIWANDRNDQNELGVVWAGPFVDPATASTQSSALDALVAAVTFNGDGK